MSLYNIYVMDSCIILFQYRCMNSRDDASMESFSRVAGFGLLQGRQIDVDSDWALWANIVLIRIQCDGPGVADLQGDW